MAGLAAAWELSRPEHGIEAITLFERRPWLGGKGASVRGANGRIEEHGLHVWLGYYDNAFRLIREVYDELDREHTDPSCPIRTWRDAFRPADLIGAAARDGTRRPWLARFGRNALEPGDPQRPARALTTAELAGRALNLLADVGGSLSRVERRPEPAGLFLSSSPDPAGRRPHDRHGVFGSLSGFGDSLRLAEVGALVAAVHALTVAESSVPVAGALRDTVRANLAALRVDLEARLAGDEDADRLRALVDLVITVLRGMVTDRLLGGAERLASIDHLDFREWLLRHGARPETARSPLVNAMYDFVFAYEDGDTDRPAFAAGLGLFLASKLFFEYRGAVFWKLQAGMGDAVMVPLYQALIRRGVRIELGWDVEALHVDEDRGALAGVVVCPTAVADQALVRVKGLPCFPAADDRRRDLSHGDRVHLRHGDDFDQAVLAVSLGALPRVASELIAASSAWAEMVARVRTVATRGFQAWLDEPEALLGWRHDGATVSGRVPPFDTYASMSHLIPAEDWPAGARPASLAYFCGVVPDHQASPSATRAAARGLLAEHIGDLWPGAVAGDRFRWEVLHGGFDGQFFTSTDDPSDRYVQSLPGTAAYRLRADESGFDHLVLAGDWINSGLNAGCIESDVISGREAANVVLGRPLTAGVAGTLYGLSGRVPAPDAEGRAS